MLRRSLAARPQLEATTSVASLVSPVKIDGVDKGTSIADDDAWWGHETQGHDVGVGTSPLHFGSG